MTIEILNLSTADKALRVTGSVKFRSISRCGYCFSPILPLWASTRSYQTSNRYNGSGNVMQPQFELNCRLWTEKTERQIHALSTYSYCRGSTLWKRHRGQLEWNLIFQWQILTQDMFCFPFQVSSISNSAPFIPSSLPPFFILGFEAKI